MTGGASPVALRVLEGAFCVARRPADASMPDWLPDKSWHSATRTEEELSIVCESRFVPSDVRQSRGWRMMQVQGPLDFDLVGILHGVSAPLAAARISVFAVSTFDTDYVLVRETDLQNAVSCLRQAGIIVYAPD